MGGKMVEEGHSVKVPVFRRLGDLRRLQAHLPNLFGPRLLNEGLTLAPHCDARPAGGPVNLADGGEAIAYSSSRLAAVANVILGGVAAHAEKRMFIVANDADGYGVDRCLISGAPCGTTVANGYCHSHEFATGAFVPKGGPRRYRGRHPDKRTGLLPRTSVRRISSPSSAHANLTSRQIEVRSVRRSRLTIATKADVDPGNRLTESRIGRPAA